MGGPRVGVVFFCKERMGGSSGGAVFVCLGVGRRGEISFILQQRFIAVFFFTIIIRKMGKREMENWIR